MKSFLLENMLYLVLCLYNSMPCQKIPLGQSVSGTGYSTINECQNNCGCSSDCDCEGDDRCEGECQSCGQNGPFNVIAGENPIDTGIDVGDWDLIVVYILGCGPDGTPYTTLRQVTVLIDDYEMETVNCLYDTAGCDNDGEVRPAFPGRLSLGYPGIENPNLMGTVLSTDLQVCVTVVVDGQLN